MKIKNETISLMAISMLVLKTMLTNSMYFKLGTVGELLFEILVYSIILFVIFKNVKFEKRKLIYIFIIGAITIYTGIKVGNMVVFSSFLAILVASYTDKKKIVKVIFKTLVFVFSIHFIIYCVRLKCLGDTSGIIIAEKRYRHMLGFVHPNVASAYILWAFLAYMVENVNDYKRLIISQVIVLILYSLTQTRTLLLCVVIFDLLVIASRYNKSIIKIVSRNIFLIISLVVISVLLLYMNFNNELLNKIDKISSYRLFFASHAIKNYGYTLLGQENPFVNIKIDYYDGDIITDVMYYAFLYKYGIIYMFLLNYLVKYTTQKNETIIQILVIIWSIFAFFELYSINLLVSFPLLFGANWIGGKNE